MNPLAFYNTVIQNWVNTVEHAQSNMLAFHQAVSTIQGYRARALGQWWQQAPQHVAAILQASSPAQALAELTRWNGYTTIQATTLANDTHATRAHLFKTWQRTFASTTAPQQPRQAQQTQPQKQQPQPQQQTQQQAPRATVAATPAPAPHTQPAPTPTTETTPQQNAQPKPSKKKKANKPQAATPEDPAEQAPQQQTAAQPSTPSATVVNMAQARQQQTATATQQPQQEEQQAPAAMVVNGTPVHSSTSTTFARNTGHALNANAAPRRTASIPARTSNRPR